MNVVCNGDNSSCSDCAGVPNGDATVDECVYVTVIIAHVQIVLVFQMVMQL